MASTVVNVRLTSEMKEALDWLAREMNRPRSQLAARAIAEYVQRNARQIAAIKEGVSQLDAGLSYDFDDVLAELDTLIANQAAMGMD